MVIGHICSLGGSSIGTMAHRDASCLKSQYLGNLEAVELQAMFVEQDQGGLERLDASRVCLGQVVHKLKFFKDSPRGMAASSFEVEDLRDISTGST
jgi:hypothetical protein